MSEDPTPRRPSIKGEPADRLRLRAGLGPGGNVARVYDIDLPALAAAVDGDDVLGWTKAVLAEYDRHGLAPDR
jgi:hypothetical protein